jgi:hypothetical protein
MRHAHLHRFSEHLQSTFSGGYVVFLVLALAAVMLFIYGSLGHPPRVHQAAAHCLRRAGI